MSISTCDLSDAHPEKLEAVDPVFTSFGGRRAFSGPTSTIKCHEDNSLVREAVAEPGQGRVLVIDGGGSVRRALLGDQLAAKAVANGWSGVVVYGAVRDVDALATMDLGVKALNCHPLKTDKKGIGERDVKVRFAGVTILPGDYLYADNDGMLVSKEALS